MKLLLPLSLALIAIVNPTLSKCLGSISIKDYGDVYVVAPDWASGAIQLHDNGFTMRGNSRLYFASRCEDGWASDMYAQVSFVVTLLATNENYLRYLSITNILPTPLT